MQPRHEPVPVKQLAQVPPPPNDGGSGTICCAHWVAYAVPATFVGVPDPSTGGGPTSMPETVAASVTVVN